LHWHQHQVSTPDCKHGCLHRCAGRIDHDKIMLVFQFARQGDELALVELVLDVDRIAPKTSYNAY
jgi:hypothetical protein